MLAQMSITQALPGRAKLIVWNISKGSGWSRCIVQKSLHGMLDDKSHCLYIAILHAAMRLSFKTNRKL